MGPHPHPTMDPWRPSADDDPPYTINGREMADEETERLAGRSIFTRKFKLHRYGSDDVVREIALREYSEDVFVTIAVDQTEFQAWNTGYAPHSYDPALEYKTEP